MSKSVSLTVSKVDGSPVSQALVDAILDLASAYGATHSVVALDDQGIIEP